MATAGPDKDDGLALILSGGGARAAYQVGVLAGIAELTPRTTPNLFPIICGTSAGAINALALATQAGNLHAAVDSMLEVWSAFRSHHVMRTDWPGLVAQAWRWSRTNLLGNVAGESTTALLDNQPLRRLLAARMRFGCIEEALQAGQLRAISVSAFDYRASQSVYFYQGRDRITPWRRHRRIGVQTRLGLDHLMASTAIPLLFPPVLLNRTWYGDGAVRQQAPLSPALHLGANRVLVIGVTHHGVTPDAGQPGGGLATPPPPSLAQLGGHLLHSTFIDNLETDLEQLERMNRLAAYQPAALRNSGNGVRQVEVQVVSPSEPLDLIAARHRAALPAGLRLFLRGSGATRSSGSDLLSYLLFEAEYCNELIALGRRDALAQAPELRRFLGLAEAR